VPFSSTRAKQAQGTYNPGFLDKSPEGQGEDFFDIIENARHRKLPFPSIYPQTIIHPSPSGSYFSRRWKLILISAHGLAAVIENQLKAGGIFLPIFFKLRSGVVCSPKSNAA
jgi:hypothetical protein